jgi:PAS domain S-box-containing protein
MARDAGVPSSRKSKSTQPTHALIPSFNCNAMPWIEKITEPRELRRCIRDLVALSTLPAIWTGYGPVEIANSVAAALVSMLEADFVYIGVSLGREEPMVEVTHMSGPQRAGAAEAIGRSITPKWFQAAGHTEVIANPLGSGNARVTTAVIGTGGDAIVAAGSAHPDFPSETQRLLLGIAANNATIALQRWQAETDQRRFVTLVERSSDFVAFSDLEGRPQFINSAGREYVGLSADDDLSRFHVFDFVAPSDRVRAHDEWWRVASQVGRWVGELNLQNFKTGETIPFLVDAFRIESPRSGRPMNVATVSRDLRAQRQAEADLRRLNGSLEQRVEKRTAQLADANRKLLTEMAEREHADIRLRESQIALLHAGRLSAAGQMAAALAHELSQPLTAVSNSANAARRLLSQTSREKTGTVREIMEEIAGQSLRAGQILRRLRDFVMRGEGEKQMENLKSMIDEASAFAQIGTESLEVSMQFKCDPDMCDVFVSRIQVQQVLVNLLRNALEAMATVERRELTVTTARLDDETVEIAIADSGPGVPKEISDNLFQAFVSTKHDGMGLGLSICRSIVEAHGGLLRHDPNPGGGTIFRFTLPCVPTEANHAQ